MNNKTQSKKMTRSPAALSAGVALALSASLLSGCFGESPEQQVASAKALLEKNEPKAAVIQLKNALQQNASLAEARFLLGKALFLSGDMPGALIELDKARNAGHSNDEMTVLTAKARLLKGEADRVLADFGDSKLQDPVQRAELQVVLANAHMAKGNGAAAGAALEAALRDDPKNAQAALSKVRLLTSSKDLAGAMVVLDKLLQEQPKNAPAWRLRAELLQLQQGDSKEIIAAYQQALAADKKDVATHAGLINAFLQQRDAAAAEKQLEALRAVAPNHPQTRYNAAMVALEKQDLKGAEEQAQALLKMTPESPQALHLAGTVDLQLGSYQRAITELTMALQSRGGTRAMRLQLAQAFLRSGDTAKALQTLEPLLAETNGSPEAYALAAEIHQQAGEPAAAQELYAKLVKLDPKNSQGRIAVAMTQIERGNAQQGLEALRALAKSEPGSIRADMALINALQRRQEFDKAMVAIDLLDQKQPGKPQAAVLRGRIETLRGRPEKAREAFEQALKLSPGYLPAATALAGMDIRDRKPEEAIKRFEAAASANPESVEAKLAVIGLRAQKGEKRETLVKQLEALVKEFPKEAGPLLSLGSVYLDGAQAAKAVEVAQRGRQAFPGNAAFVELLGRAFVANKDLNQALNTFAELGRMQPRSPIPPMRQAEVQAKLKDTAGAITLLKKSLALKADHVPAQIMLASLLVAEGQMAEARQLAKTVQAQRAGESVGWVLSGDIELSARNAAAAAEAYKTALAKQESTDGAVKLLRAYRLAGKDGDAVALESSWTGRHPSDAGFVFAIADHALASGDVVKAQRLYRKVLELQPDNVLALNNLVWLLNQRSDPEAKTLADKLLGLAPEAPAVLDTVASVYAKAGQHAKAIELQLKSLSLAPSLHLHRLHLAEIYLAAGKKEEARKELTQLSGMGKEFAQQAEVQRLLAQVGGAR